MIRYLICRLLHRGLWTKPLEDSQFLFCPVCAKFRTGISRLEKQKEISDMPEVLQAQHE